MLRAGWPLPCQQVNGTETTSKPVSPDSVQALSFLGSVSFLGLSFCGRRLPSSCSCNLITSPGWLIIGTGHLSGLPSSYFAASAMGCISGTRCITPAPSWCPPVLTRPGFPLLLMPPSHSIFGKCNAKESLIWPSPPFPGHMHPAAHPMERHLPSRGETAAQASMAKGWLPTPTAIDQLVIFCGRHCIPLSERVGGG
jgi:hypothetical protein